MYSSNNCIHSGANTESLQTNSITTYVGYLLYVHKHNSHLAFIYKEGSTVHYNHNGIEIKIKDACQLRITPQDIDWQFAHTIKCILTNEIADLFGAIPSTFYEWLNTHDSFSEYYKKGWMKK